MNGSPFDRIAGLPLPARLGLMGAALALIAFASSLSGGGGPGGFTRGYLINLLHVPLYALVAMGVMLVGGPGAPRKPAWLLAALLVALLAGWLDEWHQASVPGRASSALDLGSDLLGALMALAFARWAGDNPHDRRAGTHLVLLAATVTLVWGFFHFALPENPPPFLPA